MTRGPIAPGLRRWLAGFLAVAVVSIWCFHAPLAPLAIAGVVTLLITIWRVRRRGNSG